jgi:hypothetical protein
MNARLVLFFTLVAALGAGAATDLPTFTLGSPRPATVRDTDDASANEWLAANPVFVATAGFVTFTNAVSSATSPFWTSTTTVKQEKW